MGDESELSKYSLELVGDELRTILRGCSNEQVQRMLSRLGPQEEHRLLLRLGGVGERGSRAKALETALKLALDQLDQGSEGKVLDVTHACRAVLEGRFEKHPLVSHWEDIANFGRVPKEVAAFARDDARWAQVEELRLHARGVLRAGAEFLETMTRSNIEHASGCVDAAKGMLAKADEILEKGIT